MLVSRPSEANVKMLNMAEGLMAIEKGTSLFQVREESRSIKVSIGFPFGESVDGKRLERGRTPLVRPHAYPRPTLVEGVEH